jgi:hypothetical protein
MRCAIIVFELRFWFSVLFFILVVSVSGKQYYVDSVLGNDSNNGTSAKSPWRTLGKAETTAFEPGDTLYFVCGSDFNGGMEIKASGTAEKPILFAAYGKGIVPKFTNPNPQVLNGNVFRLSGSYLVIDGLCFYSCAAADTAASYTDVWDVGAVRIMLGANYCIVKNCEFSDCPKGIQSSGEYALITRNYLHSANSRPLSLPGWGPIGIHMGNSHQEVSYNVITDYYFIGGEFGADGGALEIDDGRNPKRAISIHHNYTSSNMGFLEVSWFADIAKTETYDLRIFNNVSDDYQDFVMLWAPTHDTYIENNTVFRRKQVKNAIVPAVFICDYGGNIIRNNLVMVDSLTQVFTGKVEFVHTNIHTGNVYLSLDGTQPNIGTKLDPSERSSNSAVGKQGKYW